MVMRQLGAPVKHETSHPSALLGTPSWTCRCLSGAATTVMAKARGPGPAASSRTGTAGSRVGARCCARSLGRRPPVAVPRVGAPSPPPGASTAAPPTGNGTLVPRPQVDCKGGGWWEKIALWARVMPSIRRKGRTRCGPHRRDSRRTRRSKQLRRRPQVAGRPLQALCSRKKAVMTCGNNRSFFPSAAFLNCQT